MKMLRQRIKSFGFAFRGIFDLFRTETNARIHAAAAAVTTAAGFYFSISVTEWCLCVFAISSVLAAEAMNTGLEHLTDLVSPEYHVLAGKAKDAAAAAVLLTAAGAAIVGVLIFLPKILLIFT